MKSLFFAISFLFIFISCGTDRTASEDVTAEAPAKAKNIILLIGDGMGVSQVSTAIYFREEPSNFLRFTHTGFINTSSTSHKITDSAAGGTAFSAGTRTYNGAIGVGPDTASVKNIVEIVSGKGYQTGVISTSSITHATPAAFYAHTPSRGMQEEIAAQLVRSEVDVFLGGGTKFFEDRSDGLNYIDSLMHHGFEFARSLDNLTMIDPDKKYGVLAAEDGMLPAHQGRGDFLPEATAAAIDYLSTGGRSFFLMVEGSQIDWAGHGNDSTYMVNEMLDFDKTLQHALDFAEKDGNTLVIVTADHETGGLGLSSTPRGNRGSDYDAISLTFSTGGHTATLIPVFAYGPGAEAFTGIYNNNDIFHKMVEALGMK